MLLYLIRPLVVSHPLLIPNLFYWIFSEFVQKNCFFVTFRCFVNIPVLQTFSKKITDRWIVTLWKMSNYSFLSLSTRPLSLFFKLKNSVITSGNLQPISHKYALVMFVIDTFLFVCNSSSELGSYRIFRKITYSKYYLNQFTTKNYPRCKTIKQIFKTKMWRRTKKNIIVVN